MQVRSELSGGILDMWWWIGVTDSCGDAALDIQKLSTMRITLPDHLSTYYPIHEFSPVLMLRYA